MTAPLPPAALPSLLSLWSQINAVSWEGRRETQELSGLSEAAFRTIMLEALLGQSPAGQVGPADPEVEAERLDPAPAEGPPTEATPSHLPPLAAAPRAPAASLPAAGPPGEADVIAREAARTGTDPALLTAIRKAENGRQGREFGVLSAAAPTLDAQARVAANTVRNTLLRYAQRGGQPVDPASGRYTEGFLRYLSARYAPVGAPNDPLGLNRNHAANLIALYRRVSGEGGKAKISG